MVVSIVWSFNVIHDLDDIWGYLQRAHSGSVLGTVTTKMQIQERTALFSTNGHSAQSAAHVTRLSVSMKRKGPLLSHILQSSASIRAACRRGKPDKDVDLLHQHRKKDQVCRP